MIFIKCVCAVVLWVNAVIVVIPAIKNDGAYTMTSTKIIAYTYCLFFVVSGILLVE